MKIEIDVTPERWWIEGRLTSGVHTVEALVRFRLMQDGNELSHEERFSGTPDECLAFVRRYFPVEVTEEATK